MSALLLVGAGGQGRVVADIAEVLGYDSVAFADDQWPGLAANRDWPVVGAFGDLARLRQRYNAALVSVGNNRARLSLHRKLAELAFDIPTLIHPSAVVSPYARIGRGSVAAMNAVVGAFAIVGEAVILNTACTIDHDCAIADAAHISPGANLAGGVKVGTCSWIGIGASVRELVAIGDNVTIGGGSAVVSDIEDGVTAFGVPARPQSAG